MNRTFRIISVLSAVGFGGVVAGCQTGGVGDPCTPEDEYAIDFSGFSVNEVNVESRSFQCETRVCLVNHFQGRVSCPYGNSKSNLNKSVVPPPPDCVIPASDDKITAAVDPQILTRRAADAVYCSCRCNGPESDARYCECPSGFSCVKLVDKLPIGKAGQLAGSYCIRESTAFGKGGKPVVTTDTCKYPQDKEICGDVTEDTGEPI